MYCLRSVQVAFGMKYSMRALSLLTFSWIERLYETVASHHIFSLFSFSEYAIHETNYKSTVPQITERLFSIDISTQQYYKPGLLKMGVLIFILDLS